MSNEKYLDYAGLQHYHEKLLLELGSMEIADDEIDMTMFEIFHTPEVAPAQPETWTVSSNGTLNLSSSTAYVYEPEGAGRKSISLAGNTDEQIFWLKLVDGGNFFIDWDSSIEWASGSEPELTAFYEDIFLFYKENGKWIGMIVASESITPYWKLTINIPAEYLNPPYALPIPINKEAIEYIDWGDGTIESAPFPNLYSIDESFVQHEYQELGRDYQIILKSSLFQNGYLVSADAEVANMEYNFTPYVKSIDSPLPHIKGTYQYGYSLSERLNDGILTKAFHSYSSLESIPEKLFYNNASYPVGEYCFYECYSLETIPSKLFAKSTSTTDFSYCFYGCESLKDFKLIIGSPSVTSFSGFVPDASNVTRILCVPPNSTTYDAAASEANASNGITVSTVETDCLDVFEYTVQTDLSEFSDPSWDDDYSPLVAAVPIEPVQNATASLTIDWGDGNAVELQPSSVVEANLIHTYATAGTYQITVLSSNWSDYKFMAVNYVESSDPSTSDPVIQTFRDKLVSLDSPMPPLANTDLIYWFQYCQHLTTINSHLFYNLPNVTSAKGCFARCESLASIPEGLFAKNTAITSFSECFRNCFGIQTIPEGLFANNAAATDFSNCFSWCDLVPSIPEGLFANNAAATNFSGCFGRCHEIQTIPENLFANNTAATTFYNCFYNCNKLGGFTIHIGSSLVTNASDFVSAKSGTTRIIYVPSSSTTQTTFNGQATSLKLTIRGE